jgi:hypothetical protein
MSQIIKAVYLFLLILAPFVSAASQSAASKDDALPLEKRRALWLLDQLFERVKACDDETFRIEAQADLADVLWKYDEPRARAQFEESFQAIDAIKTEPQDDPTDPPPLPQFGPHYQLRRVVLELIARHDTVWARKLGDETGVESSTEPDSQSGPPPAPTTPAVPSTPLKPFLAGRSGRPAGLQDLLSQADTARSPAEKDNLYARAAVLALAESDFERALAIAGKVSPSPSRLSIEARARQRAAVAALSKEDFVEADRYARDLPNLVQRATVVDQLLRALEKRKDTGRAAEVLAEAEQSLGKTQDGPEKASALLIIAGAAARLDPLRGFEILRSAITAINKADTDNKSLDKYTPNFDQVLPLLARADFDRVLQLALSLDRKEYSVLAQMALCRAVLGQTRDKQ